MEEPVPAQETAPPKQGLPTIPERDITDRQDAEARLKAQSERFKEIIDNTDAGYFRVGIEGNFEDVNPAWLRMYGYSRREDIIGQHFSSVQLPQDRAKAENFFKALMRGE